MIQNFNFLLPAENRIMPQLVLSVNLLEKEAIFYLMGLSRVFPYF